MKQIEREIESQRVRNYLEHVGKNHNDEKTKAAYKRFKTPPWYLRSNTNKENSK